MKPQLSAYLESWAQEIASRANRVRYLIGDAHWLSDGHHKEVIIREFIQRYLPSELTVTHGFIKSLVPSEICSPEVDVLVVRPSYHPAFFAEGGLQIVPPSCVVAHLQIKTKLDKTALADALNNVYRVQRVIGSSADANAIWRAVFFFDVPNRADPSSYLTTIRQTIIETRSKIRDDLGDDFPSDANSLSTLLPTCITTLTPFTIFLSSNSQNQIELRMFDLEKLSFACAFADFFAVARHKLGGAMSGELDRIIECLGVPAPVIEIISFDEVKK